MRRTAVVIELCVLLLVASPGSVARGVSPYLPMQLEPEIERQIERVLILAGRPALTRPIPAAIVLDALPAACARDALTCQTVRRYLTRYMRSLGITHLSAAGYSASGAKAMVPNAYGRDRDSSWAASASGFWQPSDYLLLSAGVVAYAGETSPAGSMVSIGLDRAQLDIGYRGHWLSSMSDSSMLLSTEAMAMPSVTLSNYVPFTRLGLHYEVFAAKMSPSDNIAFEDRLTSGRPRLGGLHLSMEPIGGWALGANRLLQFGGGERNVGVREVVKAFFNPARFDNPDSSDTSNSEFGNQLASFTSRMTFPGPTPFSVYFEYAGEDTSAGKNLLLGNSSISAGIHFAQLWKRFDLAYETTEWQNGWYTHHIYRDGLVNDGRIIGAWFADQRKPGDAVGGHSHMLRLGWYPTFPGSFDLRLRTMLNEGYSDVAYERAYELALAYARPWGPLSLGAEVARGRDVFGEGYTQLGLFVRLDPRAESSQIASSDAAASRDNGAEIFVSAGASAGRVRFDEDNNVSIRTFNLDLEPYLGIGARRAISQRSDLGVRAEIAEVDGHKLLAVRAVDYRYRLRGPIALSGFLGAARYDVATPAQGLYGGLGLEWRDIIKGWSLGLDASCAFKVARDHLLASDDTDGGQPDSFYDIYRATVSLTRRF